MKLLLALIGYGALWWNFPKTMLAITVVSAVIMAYLFYKSPVVQYFEDCENE